MSEPRILVLTYHSVSSEPGPTSTPVHVFRMQMEQLAASGYRSMTVQDFVDWRAGKDVGNLRALITFDDGFADFAVDAHPVMAHHGFTSLMFVPTRRVGAPEAWAGANTPARQLMTWDEIKSLSKDGVEFGSHSLTHANLPRLSAEDRREEIFKSAEELSDRLGVPTRTFAAPYGHVSPEVIDDIRAHYELGFGVRMDFPRIGDDPADIPRVDMHYFRDGLRWPAFLAGDDVYFHTRRAMRAVKSAAMGLFHG